MIPKTIKIKNKKLPDQPGVYFYFNSKGSLLYVGKATSLKRRVSSYFNRKLDTRIAKMVSEIVQIDYIETPTVIEALVLEANQIKAKKPKYNILQRDDKTFLYLVITNEEYPRPVFMRGHDLRKFGINPFAKDLTKKQKEKFLRVFGPYTSSRSLKMSLELIRKVIPWSICYPPAKTKRKRACFDSHIGKCPGVCKGTMDRRSYLKIIRQLILFFDGKKKRIESQLTRDMKRASKEHRFEDAQILKRKLFALKHIRDIALISKDDMKLSFEKHISDSSIRLDGRIEAYDISNISGTSAVGSMVVFEEGRPAKSKYRKFKIKTVKGPNDVAMMEEVIRRRLKRSQLYPNAWPLPELMVIDGGKPQVNKVQSILREMNISVPVVGLAKGPDRKQDRLIFDRSNVDLLRIVKRGKVTYQQARDEAHRFAVKYHRTLRTKNVLKK